MDAESFESLPEDMGEAEVTDAEHQADLEAAKRKIQPASLTFITTRGVRHPDTIKPKDPIEHGWELNETD